MDQPFACLFMMSAKVLCQCKYTTCSKLKAHVLREHGGVAWAAMKPHLDLCPYKCSTCGEGYSTPQMLETHQCGIHKPGGAHKRNMLMSMNVPSARVDAKVDRVSARK